MEGSLCTSLPEAIASELSERGIKVENGGE